MESEAKQSQAKKKRKSLWTNSMRLCKMSRDSSSTLPRVAEEEEGVCDAVADGRHEVDRAWRNLDLILLLQNKDFDTQKKIELAHGYMGSRVLVEADGCDEECEVVDLSHLVVFLGEWVQSSLISSVPGKKTIDNGKQQNVNQPWWDLRCWEVLEFSLQKSSQLHANLNLHRKLLNPILCVARHMLSKLRASVMPSGNSSISDEVLTLFSVVIRCAYLFLTPYAGLINDSMGMWISIVETAIELVNQVFSEHHGQKVDDLVLQFSCFVLEPFSKYLCVRPPRKTVFGNFVNKLMEPLLQLFGHLFSKTSINNLLNKLLMLAEEILSYGVFHPIHIDGFLTLNSTNKYLVAPDEKSRSPRTTIFSYHRHLFIEYKSIMDSKKFISLSGSGHLFHVFVERVKKLKGVSVLYENIGSLVNTRDMEPSQDRLSCQKSETLSRTDTGAHDTSYGFVSLSPEFRKSVFDFFVEIMEPIVYKIHDLLKHDLEVTDWQDLHYLLKTVNSILSNFISENFYVRGEDISGGGTLVFLKKVYEIILSISTRLYSVMCVDHDMHKDTMSSLSVELVMAIDYLLEIEYEVYGKDLTGLWHLMLTHLCMGLHLKESNDRNLLIEKVVGLGCKMLNLFGDLRQVTDLIFALCNAARLLNLSMIEGEINPYEYVDAVGILACSKDFRLAVCAAISAIPEGQASGCIQQLAEDISGTLEWVRASCLDISRQWADRLGFVGDSFQGFGLPFRSMGSLSEIYSCVLDSCIVTAGNSKLIGSSMENLVTAVGTNLVSLVGSKSEGVKKFLYSIMGEKTSRKLRKGSYCNFQLCACWASVFFFRLYMSARSLYRQIISLMPPNSSVKLSVTMGDSFTAFTGKDWIERSDWIDEGYFSWIVKPSSSLPTVIQSISDCCVQNSAPDCYSLVLIFHMMAIQRLVDLKRMIKSGEYVAQCDNLMLLTNSAPDAKHTKLEKDISSLRQEAQGLTNIMMGCLKFISEDPSFSASLKFDEQGPLPCQNTEWNLGVSSVTKESFPAAFWWIICRNIDVWCIHAAKKDLMIFFSLLIRTFLLSEVEGGRVCSYPRQLLNASVGEISSAVLGDISFYEHRFVRRHFPSRFCSIIEKLLEELFDSSLSGSDLCSSYDWDTGLCTLEKPLPIICTEASAVGLKQMGHPEVNEGQCAFSRPLSIGKSCRKFAVCMELINLLCWIPKEHINSKSLSCYAKCILTTERLVVSSLFECNGASHSAGISCQLKLLLSCRRALNFLFAAFNWKSSGIPIIFKRSHVTLWLLKSVVLLIGFRDRCGHDSSLFQSDVIFSLIDHTFNILLKLGDYYFFKALCSLLNAGLSREVRNSDTDNGKTSEDRNSPPLTVHGIKGEMQDLFGLLECTVREEKFKACSDSSNLSRVTPLISFLNGLLWGAVSALNNVGAKDRHFKAIGSPLKNVLSDINFCISLFVSVADLFLDKLLVSDGKRQTDVNDAQTMQVSDCSQTAVVPEALVDGDYFAARSNATGHGKSGVVITFLESYEFTVGSMTVSREEPMFDKEDPSTEERIPNKEDPNCDPSISGGDNCNDLKHVDVTYLQSMLKGDNPEAAFLLRHLLIGFSAILKLQSQALSRPISPTMLRVLLEVVQVLIAELINPAVLLQSFTFVWLDGIFMYLEHLGNYFHLTNAVSSGSLFAQLIQLHFMSLGKCIALQGKRHALMSHEMQSNTKNLRGNGRLNEGYFVKFQFMDGFISRIRTSFSSLLENASELHLLSVVQAIERMLVGVQEDCPSMYAIATRHADGEKVSPYIAASIDFFDLLLHNVSGRKRLHVVKRHVPTLTACLFNIILHVHNQEVFLQGSSSGSNDYPDTGSLILMCIKVLVTIFGKHTSYKMESWHVSQSLHTPTALFQPFLDLFFNTQASYGFSVSMDQPNDNSSSTIDPLFSVDLYAACCQLLYTVLKHHKRETERCIHLLQGSANVLLHCLENVDPSLVAQKGSICCPVQETVKCASFMRRIYEEIRQQKDVFSPHSFKFLSSYVYTYSGLGPLKSGFRREVDEALRPGVYALIEVCSADDLQYLHTVFGEGACRNTLRTLLQDYKVNFQYEGKV